MTENEYCKEFIKRLASLAAAMGEDVSKERQRAYWEFFKTKDPEATLAAIERAFGECRFFPKPADIMALMDDSAPVRADAAWAGVLALLDVHEMDRGYYAVTDGATAWAVKQMGGYCTLRREDTAFLGKRFRELYEMAAENGLDKEAGRINGARLPGTTGENKEFQPMDATRVPPTIAPPVGAVLAIEDKRPVPAALSEATAALAAKMGLDNALGRIESLKATIAAEEAACPELSRRPETGLNAPRIENRAVAA